MIFRKYPSIRTSVLMVVISASGMAEENVAVDWRLELLSRENVSSETPALQEMEKRLTPSEEGLEIAVARLGAEDFRTREQAQQEILKMGRDVLPWIRRQPRFNDAEVRVRLGQIERALSADGRWMKEDLLREAVTSLLNERLGRKTGKPAGCLLLETFDHDAASLAEGYRRFRFKAGKGMTGRVSEGILRMAGNHAADGDQCLLLDAERVTGQKTFPDSFQIEARLGGDPGGEGAYHVGISVGSVRVLFHPGFQSGGFRIERVDDHKPIISNTAMGFDPPAGKLLRMHLEVRRRPGGDVEIQSAISNGGTVFRKSAVLAANEIGVLNHIGLERSGRNGGDGLFDDLVVHLGDP